MEIELKLALAGRDARRFMRHAALQGIAPVRRRLYSLYFDTPGFDLLRRGMALRVRRDGRRWVQTLKARAGEGGVLSRRPEWEAFVTGRHPDIHALPEEARACILPEWRAAFQPVFETEFSRVVWLLPHGRSRIEVALDRGAIRAGGQEMSISEVELELKSGEIDDIFSLAEDFLAAGIPLHLEPRSKAQRAYQLAGVLPVAPARAEAPRLDGRAPATTAYAAMVRACMGHFEANLPGLRAGGDTEYLHQARVAIRRLRAVVGLLRGMRRTRPAWADELRWLMGELSQARDWDVLVTETLSRAGPDALPGPLLDRVEACRAQAGERARQAAGSSRLARLWIELERELHALRATEMTTLAWAMTALDRRHRQLQRLGRRLEQLDATQRHALRIAAKKLRYACDFFSCLWPKRGRAYLKALARLQEGLGRLNDLSVATALLDGIAAGLPASQASGRWRACLDAESQQCLAALGRDWSACSRLRPYWHD